MLLASQPCCSVPRPRCLSPLCTRRAASSCGPWRSAASTWGPACTRCELGQPRHSWQDGRWPARVCTSAAGPAAGPTMTGQLTSSLPAPPSPLSAPPQGDHGRPAPGRGKRAGVLGAAPGGGGSRRCCRRRLGRQHHALHALQADAGAGWLPAGRLLAQCVARGRLPRLPRGALTVSCAAFPLPTHAPLCGRPPLLRPWWGAAPTAGWCSATWCRRSTSRCGAWLDAPGPARHRLLGRAE